jgi:hypothetical protein
MHFHGALEPLLREGWNFILPSTWVHGCTSITLMAVFIIAGGLILYRWYTSAQPNNTLSLTRLCATLTALVLLCLPTIHPWYFYGLVIFLPFTRSRALRLWTALAPLYWLHGLALHETGQWGEIALVTTFAHVPVLALLMWEWCGKPRGAILRTPRVQALSTNDSLD